ncbi:MAG: 2-oxoacid:acceptor oxidoreductase subunit alpha [Arenicellales bacterium]|nr:2-oxoacid:acceptor oxidoreductase subunit alpha [Arenicellales bacterium]MDP6314293.1 2-oxoacid:acceptor oxidoreductase subunit alpha [Arenicellales bacterium]MDP7119212.1 2-oxoacid:acceptor oxidoreductase subunit alpha [Arenicellales bacterium]MDP7193021.1 2-oxoacid:acceptor oxidoreductase subunit alpha [Arenicellales bacterium]
MPAAAQNQIRNLQGNHACALAAVAAGCRFYAGYPITPSSEVAEKMAAELPSVGGVFIQMEDEIASMGAVLGASIGGAKAMTATSGPGFSLKQENLGYAMGAEIPCVVINVMRGGPSTGMPTRPAQGDVMQARWGSHGDTVVIALAPASVTEVYSQTVRAFNLSEQLRVPVIMLIDEVIGHLVETVAIPAPESLVLVDREWASGPAEEYKPYAANGGDIPAMPRPGAGYRAHVTGLTHAEDGFPSQDPAVVARMMERVLGKLDNHRDLIDCYETVDCDDAEVLVVAYGVTARAARRAVRQARAQGLRAGLFRPVTLWPFPDQALRTATANAHTVLVPEMNAGQLCLEVERICAGIPVVRLNRIDGETITPQQVEDRINELITRE